MSLHVIWVGRDGCFRVVRDDGQLVEEIRVETYDRRHSRWSRVASTNTLARSLHATSVSP